MASVTDFSLPLSLETRELPESWSIVRKDYSDGVGVHFVERLKFLDSLDKWFLQDLIPVVNGRMGPETRRPVRLGRSDARTLTTRILPSQKERACYAPT